jgi:hypothetical protein
VRDTTISAGQLKKGSSLSVTTTLKLHEPVLPLVSVAEHVMVVVPRGKTASLWLRSHVTVSAAPLLSVTVATAHRTIPTADE